MKRSEQLQEVGALLNSSLEQSVIRKRAIEGLSSLVGAEVSSLLLLNEEKKELSFEVALGEKGNEIRTIRLKMGEGIAGYVAETKEPVILNDVQSDPRFSNQADTKSGFITRNMICAPVMAHDKLIGVIQAINKLDGGGFTEEDMASTVSFNNHVGIAIENANLYEEIVNLLEGFIKASVVGIESRDPTTSGHSQRVAVLTCALGQTVADVQKGDYASITFTADQMKELRYAALLHDFGKVGVREHVLTKANKLYPDELEIIKARFNIIKLKLEVSALTEKVKRLTLGDNDKKALLQIDESLAAKVAETNDLLGFIEACNLPTVLEEGRFERLSEIGQLLFQDADGSKPYLEANEVLALSTPRGSLTDLERIEIESHVTHTYNFLSAIPWPKSLRHIPMIAYGHHETLNGSGYPRKISTHAIPIQTRIMTICDIFDALTASDRPYKKAVPLQNALDILNNEGKRGRVDAGLLDIFISAKIYQKIRLP